ncbi:hypothetical protein ACHAWF_012569 [Thalassiosira exigua]
MTLAPSTRAALALLPLAAAAADASSVVVGGLRHRGGAPLLPRVEPPELSGPVDGTRRAGRPDFDLGATLRGGEEEDDSEDEGDADERDEERPAPPFPIASMRPYTSSAGRVPSAAAARRRCDEDLHCAAASYRRLSDSSDLSYRAHSFAPRTLSSSKGRLDDDGAPRGEELLPDDDDDDDDSSLAREDGGWETYVSDKEFVFHPGRLVPLSREIIKFESPSDMTFAEARDYCRDHDECVAFGYPATSSRLSGFDNVTFVRAVVRPIEYDGEEWRTFVSNDRRKASRIPRPAASLSYFEEAEERPYRACCGRRDGRVGDPPPRLPDAEEVRSVDALPRIPCDISRAEFQTRYEMTRTPVMLVGCDASWPALKRWKYDAIASRFDNDTVWRAKTTAYGTEDYEEDTPWKDVVEDMAAGKFFYVFDQLERPHGKVLEDDYAVPPMFRDLYHPEYPEGFGPRRWFTMGNKHTGAMPHLDPVRTDAWNALVSGRKWWVLYPRGAAQDEDSVNCDEACSSKEPSRPDWYANVGAHAHRTPYGKELVTPRHVLQNPGETIYVPYGMVHSVLNVEDNTVAITANYGAGGNLEEVWRDVVEDEEDARWYKHMYYTKLDADQRRTVRGGAFWPPEEFLSKGKEAKEEDGRQEDDEDEDEEGAPELRSREGGDAEGRSLRGVSSVL